MSIKSILEQEYPNEDWSHVDGGSDGEYPVFKFNGTEYSVIPSMWPSGLSKPTSSQIVTLLSS
tara:strand:- start:589 stop:777 length:189 start_codon:yes stop_codon:yes gene_type:complete